MKIAAQSYDSKDMLAQFEHVSPSMAVPDLSTREKQHAANDERPDAQADREEKLSLQKLQHLTEAIDSYVSSLGANLKFHIDERTDTVQVEVRDPETDRLIRKIPADEMLDLAASMEKMVGILLDRSL